MKNMAGLDYTNECKSTVSYKQSRKPPSFPQASQRKITTGDRNPSATQAATCTKALPKHTPERFTAVLNSQNLCTFTGFKPQSGSHNKNLSQATKKERHAKKSFIAARRRQVGIKHSKHVRREPSAASHGDYRRSLYEVTINSMGKPQSRGENA